jgi:hypothetical protein
MNRLDDWISAFMFSSCCLLKIFGCSVFHNNIPKKKLYFILTKYSFQSENTLSINVLLYCYQLFLPVIEIQPLTPVQ